MKETTIHDIIWIGKTKSIQSWGDDTGADIIKDISKLESDMKNKKNVMYPPQFRSVNKIQIHELLGVPLKKVEKQSSVPLINAIIKQRSIKSDEEINELANEMEDRIKGKWQSDKEDKEIHKKYLSHIDINNLKGLKIDFIYEWKVGETLIMDRSHIHCASSYVGDKKLGLTTFTMKD